MWRLPTVVADILIVLVLGYLLTKHEATLREWLRRFPRLAARPGTWRIAASVTLALLAAILSVPLFIFGGFLWLSWVGALVAGVAWQEVVDGLMHTPEATAGPSKVPAPAPKKVVAKTVRRARRGRSSKRTPEHGP
jgi:hypothetical protein